MTSRLLPVTKPVKYKYGAPGPYRQLDVSNTCARKIANVGVIAGVDVSVGEGMLVGESVAAKVDVGEGKISRVVVAAIGVAGSDDATGAHETNIHVKQIPINKLFCIYCPFSAASIVC